jgi:large subunit ribosomal protein L6
MSKIGKKPLVLPEGVTATMTPQAVTIKGKGGAIVVPVLSHVTAAIEGNTITLSIASAEKQARANWGTMGAHLKNAVTGVTEGFEKKLDVQGIGFKANLEGKVLVLSLGFTHPIKYTAPEGVMIKLEKSNIIVTGIDRQLVGQVAATIRKFRKPEPYQGKGIRYVGEQVRRKEGKKVAGAA